MSIRIFLALLIFPFWASAQNFNRDTFALVIAPGLTPVVPNGAYEVGFYNAHETFRTDDSLGYRRTSLIHFLQLQRGFSSRNRLSAGLDILFGHMRFGPADEVSTTGALGDTPKNGIGAHSLSAVGVRLRYIPFVRHYEFLLQSSVYVPTASRDKRLLLGEDRVRVSMEANYSTLFAPGWYVVGQLGPQIRFSNADRKQTTYELPVNLYLIRRIARTSGGQRFYVFGNTGYYSSFEKRYKAGLRQVNWTLALGLGAQWVLNSSWNISAGWQALPGYDDSLGIKKGSYANISLGIRYAGTL